MPKKNNIGPFGEQFMQFKGKPKQAILHLKKVKKGECVAALYRDDIGYIDIVWGEVTDKEKHTGYGLAHIIDKHGKEIKQLGFNVEDFIVFAVQYGNLEKFIKRNRIILQSKSLRVILEQTEHENKKIWLLTAFDLTKKPKR